MSHMVRKTGFEPARPQGQRFLRPPCIPFHHSRMTTIAFPRYYRSRGCSPYPSALGRNSRPSRRTKPSAAIPRNRQNLAVPSKSYYILHGHSGIVKDLTVHNALVPYHLDFCWHNLNTRICTALAPGRVPTAKPKKPARLMLN